MRLAAGACGHEHTLVSCPVSEAETRLKHKLGGKFSQRWLFHVGVPAKKQGEKPPGR
jgi:hypothetical protein